MTKPKFNFRMGGGGFIVLAFLALSYVGLPPLEEVEKRIYDSVLTLRVQRQPTPSKIVLIDIDAKSLTRLGPWPWSRSIMARLVDRLNAGGVSLIGINLPLVRPETNPGLQAVKTFHQKLTENPLTKRNKALFKWISKNLKDLESELDPDVSLAKSIEKGGNVFFPVFTPLPGMPPAPNEKTGTRLSENFMIPKNIPDSFKVERTFSRLWPPSRVLEASAAGLGHGLFTLNRKAGVETHAAYVLYRGSPFPSFALRLAIASFQQKPKKITVNGDQIRLKDFRIPLASGEILLKPRTKTNPFRRIPAVDLVRAEKTPPGLKDKIALVGFGAGTSGRLRRPGSPPPPGNDQTAGALHQMLKKDFIARPAMMTYAELLAILVIGGLALLLIPRLGQMAGLGLTLSLVVFSLIAGGVLLFMMAVWMKTAYVASCVIALFLFFAFTRFLVPGKITKESIETNRLLGLSFQSQGLLDLAFDKFKKLPLDNEAKDLLYNLGLEYEQKRMINKALGVYEAIRKAGPFRDLDDRITKLKESDRSSTIGSHEGTGEAKVLADGAASGLKKVGRFEIIGELGKGSMGLVYKALDPKINRALAIKTIRFSDEFEEDVIQDIKERFFREAEIAGKLSHPSIVTIYDVGDDEDLTYMAMEFLEGKDLENFTKKENSLPFMRILDVVARVADALDFAHQSEVIHRDIKPANIMLLKNGGVKVTDFGIAKAISSSRTRTGVILGTPNYMSPEQIMGQKIDHRSDIFSLGVLFYQMLTGELPFHGENLSSLLYQITQVKHRSIREINPKIPKACEQIIDKAMIKNPDHRFQTAGEMARVVRMLYSKIERIRRKKVHQKEGGAA